MAISRSTFTTPDGSSYPQLEIAPQSDWALFDRIASVLAVELGGTWSERVDSHDERYRDLSTDSGRLTLHLQHYLGISLYPTGGADADARSLSLLDQAQAILARESLRSGEG